MTKIIGFAGQAGCGKSTAADHLIYEHGYVRVKFASFLKDMLRVVGLTDAHLEGALKEQPCDLLCGHTPRYAMQQLGTEFGRHIIGEQFWVNAWKHKAASLPFVVVDDVRYPNEVEAVRSMGGEVYQIVRPGLAPLPGGHSSEVQLYGLPVIPNDSTVARLLAGINALV